jgi:hypothetical protein
MNTKKRMSIITNARLKRARINAILVSGLMGFFFLRLALGREIANALLT